MPNQTKHDGDCWWYSIRICTCGWLHQESVKSIKDSGVYIHDCNCTIVSQAHMNREIELEGFHDAKPK